MPGSADITLSISLSLGSRGWGVRRETAAHLIPESSALVLKGLQRELEREGREKSVWGHVLGEMGGKRAGKVTLVM